MKDFFITKDWRIGCAVLLPRQVTRTVRFIQRFPIVFLALVITPVVAEASTPRIYIQEYKIKGARQLTTVEIEEAVYPYLGPGRTQDDVEKARAALEKTYQGKGYQTVSVQIPAQPWRSGSILLEVTETPVGQLRVHGARYFLPSQIRAMAPSIAEGKVINFNDVNRDIVALNQLPDQRVTPSLRQGATPGTVDVDLAVKDTFPLHGSLELNNRQSANTTELRLNGSLSYDNLWQLEHSIGGSFQLSPENPNEVKVFSGYYLARFPALSWLSLTLQGTKQDSDVSTPVSSSAGVDTAGRGDVIGIRFAIILPSSKDFSQSFNLGFDYKGNQQNVTPSGQTNTIQTGYHYLPLSVTYSAVWIAKNDQIELNVGPTFSFRGLGSSSSTFANSRVGSDGSFFYLRGDLAQTHELPAGLQLFGKIQGQVAAQPLVSGEQFGGGGLGTVRGYFEGERFGDNAILGSVELRSPSLFNFFGNKASDWRIYIFSEGGYLTNLQPLPQTISEWDLASCGIGSRIHFLDHFNGSLDLGIPLISQHTGGYTIAYDPRMTFKVWATY